jgi:hypothetical protein
VMVGVKPTAAGLRTAKLVVIDTSGSATAVPLMVNAQP